MSRRSLALSLLLASSLFGCSDHVDPTLSIPVALAVVSGDGQTGMPGAELASPLVARVEDSRGRGVPSQIVNFRVVQGGGTVFAGAAITNRDGIARERWTLGTSGPQRVEARAVDPETGAALTFAVFNATLLPIPVTVTRAGTGSGTVTSEPAGIACGTTCSASFTAGSTVTLTAAAEPFSTFTGWSGDCSGTGACVVTADAAKSVTATFVRQTFALTVMRTGDGAVTSSPAGISCGVSCSEVLDGGTVVTLTAVPFTGYHFLNWTGAVGGTTNPVVLVGVATDMTVVANFAQ